MRLQTLLLLTYLCCIQLSQGQTPCLDPYACNFNTPEECFYTDLDGLPCVVGGCTNALACNYNTDADIDNGSCEFTSCIGCANPLACNFDSLAVYDDGSCITFIDCNGICGGTWIENDCGICYDPSAESNQESTIEIWGPGLTLVEVPLSAISASVVVKGAQGGNGGGQGAILETIEFPVIPGSVIHCYAGGAGIVTQTTGGGGGASCVTWQDEQGNDLFVIAGGGGGRDDQGSNYPLMDASLSTSGNAGEQGGPGGEMGADGGNTSFSGWISGGGGGGFISANQGDYYGTAAQGTLGSYGFGGGGGCTGDGDGNSGGGGGGYSGGGGGGINKDGGGGGSFSDVALVNSTVSNTGGGSIQLTFYSSSIPDCIPGCTSELACNYDATATFDNGTCDHCLCGEGTTWDSTLQQCVSIAPPCAPSCGEGTVWDSTMAQCISIAPPCAPSCGEGTVWDPVNEECIIAIPADLNYDGCVSISDLLELLTVHGTCPPYPEWPDEPTDTTWTCGDSLEYWGSWYQTTQIGDQCWFAENLATLRYQNGDSIYAPTQSSDWYDPFDWDNGIGATCTIGQFSDLPCYDLSGSLNACNPDESLYELGRLYNWFAIVDDRNCCPSGWNVPTYTQVIELRDWLSANGFEGEEGRALKSTVGWRQFSGGDPPLNGTDDFGFTAYPAGWLAIGGGNFQFEAIGSYGFFWRQSFGSPGEYSRYGFRFETYSQEFQMAAAINTTWGGTVRCLKD